MKRNSNFELLRIIAMVLIIAFHYTFKAEYYPWEGMSFNRYLYYFLYYTGELGVNVFLLISGYFLPETTRKPQKIVIMICQCYFYTILARCILVYFGKSWSEWSLKDYLFPVLVPQYWFVTCYILIYMFSPYIKEMVLHLSRRAYAELLIVFLVIWSVFPSTFGLYLYGNYNTEESQNLNRFIWLMGMYLLGGYIRLHGLPLLNSLKRCIIFLMVNVLNLGLYIIMAYYGYVFGGISPVEFWHPNSIMEVLLSVSLLLVFEKIELQYSRIINYVAKCLLGIYMLHDGYLCYFLWNDVFRNSAYQFTPYYALHMLFAVAMIMMGGVAIDSVRQGLFYGFTKIFGKEKKVCKGF